MHKAPGKSAWGHGTSVKRTAGPQGAPLPVPCASVSHTGQFMAGGVEARRTLLNLPLAARSVVGTKPRQLHHAPAAAAPAPAPAPATDGCGCGGGQLPAPLRHQPCSSSSSRAASASSSPPGSPSPAPRSRGTADSTATKKVRTATVLVSSLASRPGRTAISASETSCGGRDTGCSTGVASRRQPHSMRQVRGAGQRNSGPQPSAKQRALPICPQRVPTPPPAPCLRR